MERTSLFRPAAVAAKRGSAYGAIVLARPLSLTVLAAFAAFAAAGVVALSVWGSYTRHTTVRGSLVPDGGLIEVQAPQYGTVVAKAVAAGGSTYDKAEDFGFMYTHSFVDPDGHGWGLFHMSALPPKP